MHPTMGINLKCQIIVGQAAKAGRIFSRWSLIVGKKFCATKRIRATLRQAIKSAQLTQPFTIDAWVLLPDHLHTIWTLPPNDADFGIRWALIKRFVSKHNAELKRNEWMNASKQKRRESTIWQRRFWEHQIRDEADFEKHADYIHYNPVKHGLVTKVCGLAVFNLSSICKTRRL